MSKQDRTMDGAGEQFVQEWAANAARLTHTYDPSQEHDNCGVGLVAALDGKPRRDRKSVV